MYRGTENLAFLELWLDLSLILIPDWKGETIDYLTGKLLGDLSFVFKPLRTLVSLTQIYDQYNLNNKMISEIEYARALYLYIYSSKADKTWEDKLLTALEIDDEKISDKQRNEIIENTEKKFRVLKNKYSDYYNWGSNGLKESFKDDRFI